MNNYSINSDDDGDIIISGDVISDIAYEAAVNVKGISKFLPWSGRSLMSGKSVDDASKLIKVSADDAGIKLNFRIVISGGSKVTDVVMELQKTVKNSVQEVTGRTVSSVNVVVADMDIPAEK
ncbi:MAG: Asp23/Gls24 family envelope stress response protein [Clostridiales bacterium]|nr:Asp23/Gls24 family envelope stress response protein [Clostridiales bacterium]